MTIYDKGNYHRENSDTVIPHIALILSWIAGHDLFSEDFIFDFKNEILQVRNGDITPYRFSSVIGEVLHSEMLNERANMFFRHYYKPGWCLYYQDYVKFISKDNEMFYAIPTDESKIRSLFRAIDRQYADLSK